MNDKKIQWKRWLAYFLFFVTGVGFAYFSFITVKLSSNFPFFELNKITQNNSEPFVYGYNILDAFASLATIIAVFIAWRELTKFKVENRSKIGLRSVQEWYLRSKDTVYHKFITKTFNRSGGWSVEVFNINEAVEKIPIFVINNPTQTIAENVKIKISQIPDLYTVRKYDYSPGKCIVDCDTLTVFPFNNTMFWRDKSYNSLDFSKNFGIEVSYLSRSTQEAFVNYFEARVMIAEANFYYIDDLNLLEEKNLPLNFPQKNF